MTNNAGILLVAAGVAVVMMAILQALQYFRGHNLISASQLVLRVLMALIMLGVIAGIFLGIYHLRDMAHEPRDLVVFAAYWTLLAVSTFVVALLALSDYHMSQKAQHRAQAELYRQMSELQDIIGQRQTRGNADKPRPDSQADSK